MSQAYKNAGVDVEAGYKAVELMKQHVKRTNIPGVLSAVSADFLKSERVIKIPFWFRVRTAWEQSLNLRLLWISTIRSDRTVLQCA